MPPKKTLIISIAALVLLIVLTVGVLLIVRGAPNKTTATPAPAPLDAPHVVSAFSTFVTSGGIGTSNTVVAGDGKTSQIMTVYDAHVQSFVQIESTDFVIVTSPNGFDADALASVTASVKTFLVDKGLATQTAPNDASVLAYNASSVTSCALSSLGLTSNTSTQLTFICASNDSDELSTIDTLIDLWPGHSTASFDMVSTKTIAEGAFTVEIVNTSSTTATDSHLLVYVKSGDHWQYIGDGGQGTPVVSNERLIINADIKAGMDNATYGAALTKALATL